MKAIRTGKRTARHRRNNQTRFLAPSILLEEIGPPRTLLLMLLTAIGAIGALTGWSAIAPLTERVAAGGEVVPSGSVLAVQHLEGGIVASIVVQEGAIVERGSMLVHLDQRGARAEYDEALSRISALAVRAERLRAVAENRLPDFESLDLPKRDDSLIRDQMSIYELQVRKRESERQLLQHAISQRQEELRALQGEIVMYTEELKVLSELTRMRETLAEKGLLSKVVLLGTRQKLISARGALHTSESGAARARQAIAEARERITQLDSETRSTAITEMGVVAAELAQQKLFFDKLRDRLERHDIRSPVRGIVKALVPTTVGGVIASGSVVAEIVPIDEELVADVRISPPDRGRIAAGQPATVRVSAYDFYRYGAVQGEITRISASTFQDDKGAPFYKARIRLMSGHVGPDAMENRILPGMTIDADILTGERTVLQYLLKPVYLSISDAFKEH